MWYTIGHRVSINIMIGRQTKIKAETAFFFANAKSYVKVICALSGNVQILNLFELENLRQK